MVLIVVQILKFSRTLHQGLALAPEGKFTQKASHIQEVPDIILLAFILTSKLESS